MKRVRRTGPFGSAGSPGPAPSVTRRRPTRRSDAMPPHCDSLDGPVVAAARQALETGDVNLVLPFVPADGEEEVRATFERVRPVRDLGPEAKDTADRLFFETVVRIH